MDLLFHSKGRFRKTGWQSVNESTMGSSGESIFPRRI
jgi:hypothetical protein